MNPIIKTVPNKGSYYSDLKDPLAIAQSMVVSNTFKQKWISRADNLHECFRKIEIKKLDDSLEANAIFLRSIFYLTRLSHVTIFNKEGTINKFIDERVLHNIKHENEEGRLCIFASILLFKLLKQHQISEQVYYMQGIYRLMFPPNTAQRRFIASEASGLHANLMVNGTIIDTTLQQIGDNYGLGNNEYAIIGDNLPKQMELFGWEEPQDVVEAYAKLFAAQINLSVEEWVSLHDRESIKVFYDALTRNEVTMERNDICFCGSGKKYKKCHL